ncbi:MAG: hypothetical protein JWM82_163 [Myxococcales bacterium]|nr:hypothetical protein [Myxococcales bacterium]
MEENSKSLRRGSQSVIGSGTLAADGGTLTDRGPASAVANAVGDTVRDYASDTIGDDVGPPPR